ncbi:MAG TPA: RagB/SusD family nutrient uptake outer membrane protein [Puia sp.]|nr:RagB/SusD family nutrient uptake outer membrane protein [Puia sp.]
MEQFKKIGIASLLALLLSTISCQKILQEKPEASIPPSVFNTEIGLVGGVGGVYNDLRSLWGTEGFSMQCLGGTDETLEGASATSTDFFTYNPMNSADESNGWWNIAYQDINTLNGVLQYAKALPPDTIVNQCVAQAHFLRAFWYFYLVIDFGDVPLHTTFITSASTTDSRQPMAQVYDTIISDLNYAAAFLQVTSPVNATAQAPFGGKAAAQGAALYLLGKTYLTRGWSSAAQPNDFQQAISVFQNLITNQATYGFGLWQDYADAFGENVNPVTGSRATWDYGKETILVSDHSSNAQYGQYQVGKGLAGGAAQNLLPWFQRWNYPANSGINSYVNGSGKLANSGASMMTRDVLNGRPYIRVRPNNAYVLGEAFDSVDRINDTRYWKTFQTVFIANTAGISNTAGATNNSRGISYTMNVNVDTAVWFPPYEVPGAPQFNGATPFKGIIIPPSLQTNSYFPANRKFDDPSRPAPDFNDPSTRPVILWRFSDVYLLCAEAYLENNDPTDAAAMINVVRERAAYNPANNAGQNAAAAAAMDITPGQVTIDFILDERTREFYGEGIRWWDLVRTKSLLERVQTWNPVEAGAHLQPYMVLRPIPQSEIDAVTTGPTFPQNNGY